MSDDLISRQELLNRTINNPSHYPYITERDVLNCPSAQSEQQWIPCSKKLPELNRSVLVRLSDDFVDPILIMTFNISKCEGDFFYFWRTLEMGIDFDMDDVVAWMPLPKPYKGE